MFTLVLTIFTGIISLISAQTILKVADCIEESSGNASTGITNCFEQACTYLKTGEVTILFPPKATLHLQQTSRFKLSNSCCSGLTIDGNGVTLIQTNPRIALVSFYYCVSLRVKNLTINYNPLPFTQGRVRRRISETELEVAIDPGFPSPTDWYFEAATERYGILKDIGAPYMTQKLGIQNSLRIQRNWESDVVTHGFEVYNVTVKALEGYSVDVGDPWVHVARTSDGALFRTEFGTNVSFEDITIHASPVLAFYNRNS